MKPFCPGSPGREARSAQRRARVTSCARSEFWIVDDAVVIRRLLTDCLAGIRTSRLVGAAAERTDRSPRSRRSIPSRRSTSRCPSLNGLRTLVEIRQDLAEAAGDHVQHAHRARRGGDARRWTAGANDYVTKPSNCGSVTIVSAQVDDLFRRSHLTGACWRSDAPPADLRKAAAATAALGASGSAAAASGGRRRRTSRSRS